MGRLVSSMQRTNVPTLFDFRRQRVTVPALLAWKLARGYKHPVSRSHPPQESHSKEHRPRALSVVQPGWHTDGHPDRSGNPIHVPANG